MLNNKGGAKLWQQIFEMQTEIQSLFSPNDEFFGYFDPGRPSTCQTALAQLERYVAYSGPFDGVLAFSQGAALASTLIVHLSQLDPAGQTLAPVFKVAVFIAGGVPVDPDLLIHRGELRQLSGSVDGCLISIPTANIYGRNDTLWPGSSEQLSELCDEKAKAVLVHDGGHEVPGSGTSKDALISTVKVIRRAVDKAMHAQ
ncbi:hypothetical protein MMC34_004980 [Xylographa carneopallida]|nr:hypothetical protein [Xylographa carneopallida]